MCVYLQLVLDTNKELKTFFLLILSRNSTDSYNNNKNPKSVPHMDVGGVSSVAL